jgi:diguanylate cyclase (GGDEF)-like protein
MSTTVLAATISTEWLWCGAAALLLCAIVAGFVAGVLCAPALQEWMRRRAARSLKKLYEVTFTQLERSEMLCRQLGAFSDDALTAAQWTRLDDLAQQLHVAWRSVADKYCPQRPQEKTASESSPNEFTVEWKRSSVDPATQLPDRAALEENLDHLLAASTASSRPSGVLLVALDKGDQLRKRFGVDVATLLEARLATVLIKAARNEDLVCRVGHDSFAVLLPCVSPLAGARVAESLRSAVRQHRFRATETGSEIVVTASFGYTACLPGDPLPLVFDRAGAALAKSQTCGRNQLHVHDAYHQTVCRVG